MNNPINNYVPKFVANNLKWYERDGLLTWYDHCKCDDFLRDTDAHFKDAKIDNFNIIRKQCRGEEVRKDILVEYQMVTDNFVLKYPEKEKKNILSSAFRTDREDIYFHNKTKKHFTTQRKSSIKKVIKKKLREKL